MDVGSPPKMGITVIGKVNAGAVLSLEASRLARSCTDWHRLLEICALTDTLVIDEDGVYDPGQYADRLLLGILSSLPYSTEDYTSAPEDFPEARPQPRLRAT